eukprot:9368386-Prorocentrum_lima.AAC.1
MTSSLVGSEMCIRDRDCAIGIVRLRLREAGSSLNLRKLVAQCEATLGPAVADACCAEWQRCRWPAG